MIHPSRILPMATFSLLSVLAIQAANTELATTQAAKTSTIPISYLPFTITAPGTYVVTKNLSFSSPSSAAITISTALSGPVVLDLKGFTLTGGGGSNFNAGIGIGILPASLGFQEVSNTYPITVRNGTIQNFEIGVLAGVLANAITLNNLTLVIAQIPSYPDPFGLGVSTGVSLFFVNSSYISNCVFGSVTNFFAAKGIADTGSLGGNRYTNDSFNAVSHCIDVTNNNGNTTTVLGSCQFAPPPSN
jgi:hypothetical protein